MKINNTNSTNFYGYKNIIANKVFRPNGEKISYMSMQLDNFGKKDLATWHLLQEKLMNRNFTTDVVTFNMYERDDDNIIGFSSELLDLDEVEQGTEYEKLLMKAYTFIADLTNRIKGDYALIQDENYRAMAYETKTDLADFLFGDKHNSAELDRAVFGAYYSKYCPQDIAEDMNNKIHDTMMDYFS